LDYGIKGTKVSQCIELSPPFFVKKTEHHERIHHYPICRSGGFGILSPVELSERGLVVDGETSEKAVALVIF
jgi:hypothetical protein